MKKSDLRTGMWVEMANGDLGMILLNVNNAYDYIIYKEGFDRLSTWTEDLLCDQDDCRIEECDIIKIYDYNYSLSTKGKLLWERGQKDKKPINLTINIIINNEDDLKLIDQKVQETIKKIGIYK